MREHIAQILVRRPVFTTKSIYSTLAHHLMRSAELRLTSRLMTLSLCLKPVRALLRRITIARAIATSDAAPNPLMSFDSVRTSPICKRETSRNA
jgi:hypothetical protein